MMDSILFTERRIRYKTSLKIADDPHIAQPLLSSFKVSFSIDFVGDSPLDLFYGVLVGYGGG